jgi:acetyl-CoA acetyltransferase
MRDVAVYGVGTTTFALEPGRTSTAMVAAATREALDDAGVDRIDAVYLGTAFGEMGAAQRALRGVGISEVPIVRIENACASGTTAFHEGWAAIAAERYEHVLAIGVEHMSQHRGAIPPEPRDPEGATGLALPALYAMSASHYAAAHGVTDRELAAVAVKNRRHGAAHPRAQHPSAVTEDEVLRSRMIAEPLTRLQCSSISDGAGAAVLGPARDERRDVAIRSSALGSGGLWDYRTDHAWGYEIVARVARQAYEQAGIGVDDVDVFEMHDAFTIGEIVTTEAIGLAAEGEGAQLIAQGGTSHGGRAVVNPSGGLLARGHPLGATGLAQIAELVWQLRGDAGGRQVSGARIGVVETMGGGVSGLDGNACVVAVLEAGGRVDRADPRARS